MWGSLKCGLTSLDQTTTPAFIEAIRQILKPVAVGNRHSWRCLNLIRWWEASKGISSVERRWIGGSCPNIACLPSKNEIWSARVAHLAQHAAQFGTIITGPVTTDMARIRQRKQNMVDGEIALHLHNYKTTGGELIMGTGRFVAPKTLEVRLNDGGTRVLAGDQVFLNVGTHAAIPSVPGLEAARPLTHIEALELDYLPSHLIVLGGGYVGLEMAQAYRRFGSRVTIIEAGPQFMTREDPMSQTRCSGFSVTKAFEFC
jgi:pyruvate/2-oxoglutarate dehydrogenase complex dihydrolipoamide dehydrogenase (E3) component